MVLISLWSFSPLHQNFQENSSDNCAGNAFLHLCSSPVLENCWKEPVQVHNLTTSCFLGNHTQAQQSSSRFVSAADVVPRNCSSCSSRLIGGLSNTPTLVFSQDKGGTFLLKYLKQSLFEYFNTCFTYCLGYPDFVLITRFRTKEWKVRFHYKICDSGLFLYFLLSQLVIFLKY